MVFKTLRFLFFAIFLVITKVSAYEFENENAKKPKAPTPEDMQTPPLRVNKVYDDKKTNLEDIIKWITGILPEPKTPANPTPKAPQNPMPKVPPPSKKAPPPPPPPPPPQGKEEDDYDCKSTGCRNRPRKHA